ncbi:MAG: sigma-54-dependent transcriptional regulator, partial [Bacteroidota bacterium]
MAKKHGNILVVDDNEGILKSLNFSLKFEFTEVITIKSPNQIPSILRQQSIDVILLDMNFSAGINSGNEGIFWLREIMKLDPDIVVILITAYGDVELAVKGIKEGATDFILKPWNDEKLLATLHNALRLKQQKTKIKKLVDKEKVYQSAYDKAFSTIIGESDEMKKVIDTISKVSGTEANVLILGENGTGKELIAREVHRRSLRRKNTFLSVDIASLSETLMESELFGHVKGAFTSAHEDRKGRFELASGGTLFLDEIGNLTMRAQTKLLSALQSRKIIPLGSNRETAIDIRLLSATNRPIYDMVSANTFREDLLFRLNTIE